jgi:capsule biosynthesis phosphatase
MVLFIFMSIAMLLTNRGSLGKYIVCIPLGGIGKRFRDLGYTLPKPLIRVMGKPILYWLLDSLGNSLTKNECLGVLIPYNNELSLYNFENTLRKDYPGIRFIFHKLKCSTRGAADTIKQGLLANNNGIISSFDDCPILCLDGDNFYNNCNPIEVWKTSSGCGNCVICFRDDTSTSCYSFLEPSEDAGEIVDIFSVKQIREKQRISDYASTGGYGFNSWQTFSKLVDRALIENIQDDGEIYTSTIIQQWIRDVGGQIFKGLIIPKSGFICLGTPLQVRIFCNDWPRISSITSQTKLTSKRYCFDLDGTLVSFPKIPGDYSTVDPLHKNINILRYLKKFGNTIIIYTARRMGTHKGNVGAVIADIAAQTLQTLKEFDIPYDEIYFGKPHADYYIDDIAVNAHANLEKELGYYYNSIDTRSFNSLECSSIETIKKTSKNPALSELSGEIYYYQNIPAIVKDLFPIILDFDETGQWYTLQKIRGIPVSRLYLSEDLTVAQLNHCIGSLRRLHDIKPPGDNHELKLNLYKNYQEKCIKRASMLRKDIIGTGIDMVELFPRYNEVEHHLLSELELYQKRDDAIIGMIHGDAVMTNLMINDLQKIKFIDMKGKLGDYHSIYGDVFYDWGKLYQSLIGYDAILMNQTVSEFYNTELIRIFEQQFSETELSRIKLITLSLLFSLIPLHMNDIGKCKKFWLLLIDLLASI